MLKIPVCLKLVTRQNGKARKDNKMYKDKKKGARISLFADKTKFRIKIRRIYRHTSEICGLVPDQHSKAGIMIERVARLFWFPSA